MIVSSDGAAVAMETGVLLLQILGFGTTFRLIWNKLTLTSGC